MSFDALDHIIDHIHANLRAQTQRPLFVALQGPQGSGKTFLTERAATALRRASLRVATLSIDDLYLPHAGLAAVANAHPANALLRGRGQPGTHDVALGARVLRALKHINGRGHGDDNDGGNGATVHLPAFDKSQHAGEGDRVLEEHWAAVTPPLDVVILEGWCVGFYPQARDALAPRMELPPRGLDGMFDMRAYALEHVEQINELLAPYVEWWEMVDVFVQITPEENSPYVHIYKWRLEQEHKMKAQNGGKGMTDEQVKAFVDRYIPGYHFFGDGVLRGGVDPRTGAQLTPPWLRRDGESGNEVPKLLRVTIDQDRRVVKTEKL